MLMRQNISAKHHVEIFLSITTSAKRAEKRQQRVAAWLHQVMTALLQFCAVYLLLLRRPTAVNTYLHSFANYATIRHNYASPSPLLLRILAHTIDVMMSTQIYEIHTLISEILSDGRRQLLLQLLVLLLWDL